MDNYLLRSESSVYYECGFSCDNELLISTADKKYFLTDSRYLLQAKESCVGVDVIECDRGILSRAKEIIKDSNVKSFIYDPTDWNVRDFSTISSVDSSVSFIPTPHFSKLKRAIKTEKEISLIQKAVRQASSAFDKLAQYIIEFGEGKSEKEIHFQASNILKNRGNFELSFDPIIAINDNAAKPHSLASNKCLKKGDLILFDGGIKFKRYCSDRTRTSFFDENLNFAKEQTFAKPKWQKIYDLVLRAQHEAIKIIKPGVKASQVDFAARDVINNGGFGKYFAHALGHGVGLDIHEFPVLSQQNEAILKEGMVFTVEPGIYIPKEFGVRIEDIVVVKRDGCKVIK